MIPSGGAGLEQKKELQAWAAGTGAAWGVSRRFLFAKAQPAGPTPTSRPRAQQSSRRAAAGQGGSGRMEAAGAGQSSPRWGLFLPETLRHSKERRPCHLQAGHSLLREPRLWGIRTLSTPGAPDPLKPPAGYSLCCHQPGSPTRGATPRPRSPTQPSWPGHSPLPLGPCTLGLTELLWHLAPSRPAPHALIKILISLSLGVPPRQGPGPILQCPQYVPTGPGSEEGLRECLATE